MPKTPDEKYQEWLEREEERFGADYMSDATFDEAHFRSMLKDELSDPAMSGNVQGFLQAAHFKYQVLPTVGVRFTNLPQAAKGKIWGTRPAYRDIVTGQFIKKERLDELLRILGK